MNKLTFSELNRIITERNKEKGIKLQFDDTNPLWCVVVFKEEGDNKDCSLESRSYQFRSDNKYFLPSMGGNSIFARNLDDTDSIRVDWYLGDWEIDYCYIVESEIK